MILYEPRAIFVGRLNAGSMRSCCQLRDTGSPPILTRLGKLPAINISYAVDKRMSTREANTSQASATRTAKI